MTNDPTDDVATLPTDPVATGAAVVGTGGAQDGGAPGFALPSVAVPGTDYNDAGVPSLDFVRDKIEGRYGRSLGSTELAQETPEARSFQEQATKREEAAHDRLEAIRRSLRGDASS